MLSRVAESLYWMSRNVERAEALARIIDVAFNRTVDRNAAGRVRAEALWHQRARPRRHSRQRGLSRRLALRERCLRAADVLARTSQLGVSCIAIARQNAASVRAELSTEVWEAINALYLFVESQSTRAVVREGPSSFLRKVRDAGVAFGGIVDATITHGEEWDFLQLGRYLERAMMTARILQTHDAQDDSAPEWQRLLEMSCASEPFARTMRNSCDPKDALAFLLLHRLFPRSVRYCTPKSITHCIASRRPQPGAFATKPNASPAASPRCSISCGSRDRRRGPGTLRRALVGTARRDRQRRAKHLLLRGTGSISAMLYTILHDTTYRYPARVHESYTVCHLQPVSDISQYCTNFELVVEPRTRVFAYQDRFGNDVQHFGHLPGHDMLRDSRAIQRRNRSPARSRAARTSLARNAPDRSANGRMLRFSPRERIRGLRSYARCLRGIARRRQRRSRRVLLARRPRRARRFPLRSRRDDGTHDRRRIRPPAQRRLPGFRARPRRDRAPARDPRTLRKRLHFQRSGELGARRRSFARVVRSLSPALRLGRLRSPPTRS